MLKETKDEPEKVIRKALVKAYPFGERKLWPYKVWLDEIKLQRKKRRTLYLPRGVKLKEKILAERQQLNLFDENR